MSKLMFEEFVKQVRDEIHNSFVTHKFIINRRLAEFTQAYQ
jgi:hypothetical protein